MSPTSDASIISGRRTRGRRIVAPAIAAVLLILPFATAYAQGEGHLRHESSGRPGWSEQSRGGRAERWREQSGDDRAKRWRGQAERGGGWRPRHSHRESRPRPRRAHPDTPRAHGPHHPHARPHWRAHPQHLPGGVYYPPPAYPPPAWAPAPYLQRGYPAPVYMDEDEADAPPRRRPAPRATPKRTAPERATAAPKPPPRRPTPAPVASVPARPDSGAPPAGETRFARGEVLVALAANAGAGLPRDLARTQRLRLLGSQSLALTGVLLVRYQIPDRRTVAAVIATLERDGRVLSAQPNYFYTLTEASPAAKSSLSASQYGLTRLRADVAHLSVKGNGVLVAVIDSGVDSRHRELVGAVERSIDVTRTNARDDAPDAHGTAVAGIIAARDQMTGVAPSARLVAIRAFAPASGNAASRDGAQGSSWAVARALEAAATAKARVINMSFAGPRDPLLSTALAAAAAREIILIAAAGNDGPEAPPAWPAADPHVIAVTATDAHDKRISVASRGNHIAIAAPGADILGPAPGDAYRFNTGSSMAAAHVTGAAALLLEVQPTLTAAAARKLLMETAKDLAPAGRDADTGAGLVDAGAAVTAAAKIATTSGAIAEKPQASSGSEGAR